VSQEQDAALSRALLDAKVAVNTLTPELIGRLHLFYCSQGVLPHSSITQGLRECADAAKRTLAAIDAALAAATLPQPKDTP
jgi:hypothetical protein